MKCLILLAIAFVGGTFQEASSIVQAARRNGGKATVSISVNSPVHSIDLLARESSLIVRGVVTAVRTKLSNDQSFVVTEFEIAAEKFYKGAMRTSPKPGQVDAIVVQRPGGTLHLDGLELNTVVNEFPASESSLNIGDQLVLFLAANEQEPGKFRIAGGPYGAFRIHVGNVVPLTKRVSARRGDSARTLAIFEGALAPLVPR